MAGRAKLEEYLDHRADRERQVLAVLTEGPRTIAAIVETIYVDYRPRCARSRPARCSRTC